VTHWPRFWRKLNKRLVQVQEKYVRNQRVFGQPFFLTLESGNLCNLRCPLCATTFRGKDQPQGMLTLENAKTIINRFPGLIELSLSLWGEPFLNKDIFEIITYARQQHIEVFIQSNFSLNHFDQDMAQRLLDSDLNKLWLSIDGASQGTYEVYRRRGDFALVMRNLELLCRLKREQKKVHPRITWKVVVNQFNDHELADAKRAADRLGVDFLAVEIETPKHLETEWKPQRRSWDKGFATHSDQVPQCYALWQVMTVNFNGDVFPCCSEWSPRESSGNLLQDPVSRIWNNDLYRSRRANNRSGAPACDDCHLDKGTTYWREWHPTADSDKNAAMFPLVVMKKPTLSDPERRAAHADVKSGS
jgi:radical SAM protein with 4Fe4S-binding SPASM domain